MMKLANDTAARETVEPRCDLCGSTRALLVADESLQRCRSVVCSDCTLIYASPQEPDVDAFNDDSFDGDAGTLSRAGTSLPDPEAVRDQEYHARWGLELVRRLIPIKKRKILDVRSQSGALSEALQSEGAEVYTVDPFIANVNYCKQVRGLANVFQVPFSRFGEISFPDEVKFDAVIGLNDHILSHLVSPRKFLNRMFEVLKPDGYLFLAEKDVLLPSWSPGYNVLFVLDTGRSHQYHLTLSTVARYLHSANFEIAECEIDKTSMTAFRHIRVVARKVNERTTSVSTTQIDHEAPTAQMVKHRLLVLNRIWRLHKARIAVENNLSPITHRIPGFNRAYQYVQKRILPQ